MHVRWMHVGGRAGRVALLTVMALSAGSAGSAGCEGIRRDRNSGPEDGGDEQPDVAVVHGDAQIKPSEDAQVTPEHPYPGYAAPGAGPDVPGPSTRISQPETTILGMVADPPGALYVHDTVGVWRISTPTEQADPLEAAGVLMHMGRVPDVWVSGSYVYWVDLGSWSLMRRSRVGAITLGDATTFALGLARDVNVAENSVQGSVMGGDLVLARDGCYSVARVDHDGQTLGHIEPWAGGGLPVGMPSVATIGETIYCSGSNGQGRTIFSIDAGLSEARVVWQSMNANPDRPASVSNIAAAGDKLYWLVTAALGSPTELHVYDPAADAASKLADLPSQVVYNLATDRDDRLYWRTVSSGLEVLRTLRLDTLTASDVRADFGLKYTDAAGEERITHFRDFELAGEVIYWLRGNPGSRPGAGDDIMRLPRSVVDAE